MADEVWSVPRRIAFRFGFIAAALQLVELAFMLVPGVGPAIGRAWYWIVDLFARVIGIDLPPMRLTGSGDTLFHYVQLLLIVILAAIGTTVWSIFDRRRAHPRLAAGATVGLRYLLAFILIGYGMAKVLPIQFPPLWVGRYDQSIGDMSPMGLLWSFMGHSRAYTFVAGLAEVVGSVLLLWRRTYLIGAALIAIVMANVVALNFCYDVPVKLFSSQLLLASLVLLLPHLRRIAGALLGHATPAVPRRVRGSVTGERARLIVKGIIIAVLAVQAYGSVAYVEQMTSARTTTELEGIWRADRVVIDDVEHPPLLTDDARWRKLIFHDLGLSIRYTTDRRQSLRMELDPKAHTITILDGVMRRTWHYQRPDPDHLVIDAATIHAELTRQPPPLLQTRGFHWVQEDPFNR